MPLLIVMREKKKIKFSKYMSSVYKCVLQKFLYVSQVRLFHETLQNISQKYNKSRPFQVTFAKCFKLLQFKDTFKCSFLKYTFHQHFK